mgnify:FL=1
MFDDTDNKKPQPPAPAAPPAPSNSPSGPKPEKDKGTAKEKADIHTMPMEYYLGDKTIASTNAGKPIVKGKPVASGVVAKPPKLSKPKAPGSKKNLNLIIILVIVVVVLGSAFLLYKSYDQTGSESVTPVVQAPKVQPMPEQPVVPVEEPEEPEPVIEPVEEPVVEEDELKFNPDDINQYSLGLLAGPDKDKDKLTDAEEVVFGTSESLNDTDGDVYKDQEEIMNFYSPVDETSVRLWEKDFVDYYTNNMYGYKILYPTTWLIQPLDQDDPSDLMISSNQNEFVNILVYEKKPAQSVDNWYLSIASSVKISQLKHYKTYNELNVVESPDGYTVYVESPAKDKVFAVNYNIGLKEKANFPNVFAMIVSSFEFVEVVTQPVVPVVQEPAAPIDPVVEDSVVVEEEPESSGPPPVSF